MNILLDSFNHLMHQFDGFFHLCFLVSVFIFVVGALWVLIRILIPLWNLSIEITNFTNGKSMAFEKPSRGIAEIDEMRRTLQQMALQLKAAADREVTYRNALIDSQEHERMRIARELHDDTIQSLVVTTHNIDRATQAVTQTQDDALAHLKTARQQIVSTIDCLRRLIADLRPTVLDELGLLTAIEMLCEQNEHVSFAIDGDMPDINQTQELTLFRTAQEALHNAERYSKAEHIQVHMVCVDSAVKFEICDDGVGFEIPCQLQEFAKQGHFGLLGIRERVQHLGGELNLQSGLNAGTKLAVTLPILA